MLVCTSYRTPERFLKTDLQCDIFHTGSRAHRSFVILVVSLFASKRVRHTYVFPDHEQAHARMRTVPFEKTCAQLVSDALSLDQHVTDFEIKNAGTARPCFVTRHLEEMIRDASDDAENLHGLEAASMQMWQGQIDFLKALCLRLIRSISWNRHGILAVDYTLFTTLRACLFLLDLGRNSHFHSRHVDSPRSPAQGPAGN